jgi:ankyrin repeat protein
MNLYNELHEILVPLILLRTSVKAPTVVAFAEKLLLASVKAGKTMITKDVVDAGIDPNLWDSQYDKTPLHYAVERGSNELVQTLLDKNADVNAQADERGTALQTAAARGNIELVRVLLDASADANALAAIEAGTTALQAAAEKGSSELVQLPLNAGADVNAPAGDIEGRTALQAAAGQICTEDSS